MKVLIADDSSFMRTIIKNYLKEFKDLSIEEAADGEETLKKFEEFNPDIVFLDIIMPKLNGLEVLRAIKKLNKMAKVIIITSVGQSAVVEEALREGAEKYITKPFKYEDIVDVINEFS
ncbi:two-component system response regulator [Candidatus Woesearchaeota archaeon]|nr:response regulator [Candidatus Woesearchaeota archaeon]RLE41493.1 MAG: two-component system response regulator [Candidatus Woesearchaeota archaeon]